MKVNNSLQQKQLPVLAQLMRKQLELLQLPVDSLRQQIQEAALSNPLLQTEREHSEQNAYVTVTPEPGQRFSVKYTDSSHSSRRAELSELDSASLVQSEKKFSDFLLEQLGEMKLCDRRLYAHCSYIIGNLDSSGYLSCSAAELSEESGIELFDIEQAILAVQMLDPAGVGARSLSECLLLQLMRGGGFNEINIHAVRHGLELVAENRIEELARLLKTDTERAKQAVATIRGLNPIPSRGYNTGNTAAYITPEAYIYREHGGITIELNDWYLPKMSIDESYCAIIGDERFPEAQDYLKENRSKAKELINGIARRQSTMLRLLSEIVSRQREYFSGGELLPMTMQQLADSLELGVSTISRAIKDKYVLVNGRILPLRAFFNSAAPGGDKDCTVDSVKLRIKALVEAEDSAAPLSDQNLVEALAAMGIKLSRRTVYNYRQQLGIADSRRRRVRSENATVISE